MIIWICNIWLKNRCLLGAWTHGQSFTKCGSHKHRSSTTMRHFRVNHQPAATRFCPTSWIFTSITPICAAHCGLVWSLDRLRRSQVISTPRNGGTEKAFWSFLECSWWEESEGERKRWELVLAETAQHPAMGRDFFWSGPKCSLGWFSRYKGA